MFIDYIIIILAVVSFAAQFAFTKVYEGAIKQTTTTTLVMLIITSVVGSVMYYVIGGFTIESTWFSFVWAAILGILMIPYYMIGIKVLSYGSLAIYSMFMMLGGMIVPFFYGVIFRDEPLTWGKTVGSIILTICIIMQALWQNADEEKTTNNNRIIFFVLCLAVFFINGFTGVVANIHQVGGNAVSEIHFTVISCAITAIISAIALFVSFISGDKAKTKKEIMFTFAKAPFLAMIAIGAAAYTGSFLILKAASNVPASVQFPLVSGGVIVLSSLVSATVFKEKLMRKEWISVAGAFVATFLFAF